MRLSRPSFLRFPANGQISLPAGTFALDKEIDDGSNWN
jgi:hypothetical protein